MDRVSGSLIVFLKNHFGGVFERILEGGLSVCKVIFGTEVAHLSYPPMKDLLNKNYRKRIEEIDNEVLDICAL